MDRTELDIIDYIAGSSNGRTTVFGTVYLGSTPSPAAIRLRSIN